MDPFVIVLFLVGSLFVLLGRAQPQIATDIPQGFAWTWLLSFEVLLASGPLFGLAATLGWVDPVACAVAWFLVGLVCAVVGRLVAIQARQVVEVAKAADPLGISGAMQLRDLPPGLRPEVVRFVSQTREVDVDAISARHDDACGRRRERARAVAEG